MSHDHHHDHHGHGHGHPHHDHAAGAPEVRLRWALLLTAGFMLCEVVAGFLTGSLALIADAGHMLTDAGALALALYAAQASRREADVERTYGYGRARVLAAFVNGLALLVLSAWIAIEAAQRLADPKPILAGPMMIVAALGLGVNVAAYLILRGSNDLNVRGALVHVLGDLLASVAAILAAGLILLTGWTPADPLLSLLVAALIVRSGWALTRESAHTLLEGAPAGFDPAAIEHALLAAVPALRGVHHIHAWTVGAGEAYITLHVVADETADTDRVIAAVARELTAAHRFAHVTVQVERGACEEVSH